MLLNATRVLLTSHNLVYYTQYKILLYLVNSTYLELFPIFLRSKMTLNSYTEYVF